MPEQTLNLDAVARMSARLTGATWLFLLAGGLATILTALSPEMHHRQLFAVIAASLFATTGLIWGLALEKRRRFRTTLSAVGGAIAVDPVPVLAVDGGGGILLANPAARKQLSIKPGDMMVLALKRWVANPSAAYCRLLTKARTIGFAREEFASRGGHARASAHPVGENIFLWRVEKLARPAPPSENAPSVRLPTMSVDENGLILFMNDALRNLVGRHVESLDHLFTQLPIAHGDRREMSGKEGPVPVQIVEAATTAGGRKEIFLLAQPTQAAKSGFDVEQLPVAAMRLKKDGQIDEANAPARDLLGPHFEDAAALSDLVEGLGRSVRDWFAEAWAGKGRQRPEFVRATRTDREVFLQIALQRFEDGGEVHVLAVMTDATALKSLEAQFVQSQKMQAIGQLAGGIAHDFNNLLTAISGHCDLLLLRHDSGDPDYCDLRQIAQNANRASGLVGQLLAFSRKQTLKPERLDLRNTLADLTHLLNRLVGEKIELTLIHDPDLRPTRADKRQLEQVVMNLVVNARDAMQGNPGTIVIKTANTVLTEAVERDRAMVPEGHYVVVKVADSGCGIPQDKLPKVFEPFFTTKKTGEGTGLGLSTVYGIVKQTGGFIFADSVVGEGTTFTLYLPVCEDEPHMPKAATAPSVSKVAPNDAVILLVEDEAPVRAFASRALRMRGYTVLEAENAEQALGMLEDHALRVDLFMADVIMPGVDGPTWVKKALKDRPDTRVVFVSGYAEEPFTEDQARIPNSVFLPKPFSLTDLIRKIEQVLHCA
ncbi:MAG: ATP-binding protein [Pseudomonadota bacterium]